MPQMYDDLRGFIDLVEQRGELRKIAGANPVYEIGALTALTARRNKSHPALLFDQIKGYKEGFRILTNTLTNLSRSKLAFGLDPDLELPDPVEYLARMFEEFSPVAPREVGDGPLFENIQREDSVNLFDFPAPKWHLHDGGSYLGTADIVIFRDPETQSVNLGTYRLQLHDKKTLGIAINPGHHGRIIEEKYWEKGLPCPVAVSLGHDPRLGSAANMYIPWGKSEYEYAGWIQKRPVEVIAGPLTGLPIPANAEIAIEGEIPPVTVESRAEGPFGEFGGYYSIESKPQPIIKVHAVYYRNNPIALGTPPFKGVPHNGILPIVDALMLCELRKFGFHDVKKIARAGPFLVVSMKVRYAGHARRVADFIVSGIGTRPPKCILIVDDDVDTSDRDDVFWAFQTRVDVGTSVYEVKNRWGAPTDPRIPPDKRAAGDITASSLIFDGTRPWAWRDQFPEVSDFPDDFLEQCSKKWPASLK